MYIQKRLINSVNIIDILIGWREKGKMQSGMSKEIRTKFLNNLLHDDEIDDLTFDEWKFELQKELPSFWESVNHNRKIGF